MDNTILVILFVLGMVVLLLSLHIIKQNYYRKKVEKLKGAPANDLINPVVEYYLLAQKKVQEDSKEGKIDGYQNHPHR